MQKSPFQGCSSFTVFLCHRTNSDCNDSASHFLNSHIWSSWTHDKLCELTKRVKYLIQVFIQMFLGLHRNLLKQWPIIIKCKSIPMGFAKVKNIRTLTYHVSRSSYIKLFPQLDVLSNQQRTTLRSAKVILLSWDFCFFWKEPQTSSVITIYCQLYNFKKFHFKSKPAMQFFIYCVVSLCPPFVAVEDCSTTQFCDSSCEYTASDEQCASNWFYLHHIF